ncbi:MAG: DUF4340 domain-containing protein [Anaerolineae bacterium]|nr:DUF4340 domain-containing protein [Anaerolineae bacterium]
MKRHNQILAGILVIQIILGIAVFWPRSAATGASEPLFPNLAAGDIVALSIVDADGNSIILRQVTGNWILPDADDYPAQADKITPLLDKIVGLTTGRLVTRTDASHKRLQVAPDDFVGRIDLETADGTRRTLYLGSSPRYGATHFRVDGQSETYLTNELSTWETKADAASWVDTAYLSVPRDDVTKMTLENTNGTFTFTKDDEVWTMAGLAADETLDENKVTALVQQAASVNMVRPLGKEEQAAYGMDEPNAVVTLETEDKTITLRVGAKDPDDNSYVVISSESPYYVRVSGYSLNNLVENTRDDFLQAPPTPTPEATSAP